jgi:Family of unknown function (DUF6353)
MNFVPRAIERLVAAPLAQKNSPEVLLVAGAVSMVGSTVLACRATLKMDEVLERAKHDISKAHQAFEVAQEMPDTEYSEQDRQRDIAIIYYRTTVSTLRLYAPSILAGAFGLALIATSNRIHIQRAAALSAAYTALDKGFKEYRARVVDKYGEDEDQRLRYGTEKVEIINPETGRKKTVERVGPHGESIYAKFFDEGCRPFSKDSEVNMFFIQSQQNWANDTLRARGHVFLNEVYDMLDIPRTKAGQVVGWVWRPDDPTHTGDNFIDFGVFRGDTQVARDFVNARENAILLDFNVDGPIYDKI